MENRLARRAKFAALTLCGAGLVGAAWMAGLAQKPFQADTTYMTHGIVVLGLVGVAFAGREKWDTASWIADRLVELGLLGTVVGFIMAFAGVNASSAGDVHSLAPMIGGLVSGMSTALYTTLVGSIGALWLSLNEKLLRDGDDTA